MKLYIVQHAEAKEKAEDPERPLTEKGRADIERVAAYLAVQAGVSTRSILHSGKTRARQTAEVLAAHLKPPEGIEVAEGLEPLANASIWEGRLKERKGDLMLVGHLPNLSKLASRLLCDDEERKAVDFRMGGVLCLEKREAGGWALRWMVIPGILAPA